MKNEEWRMITQRSTYQAENWTSNTKKPHQVIPQSYFRYEPISPSYDPNEFVKNYNKKSHQKFRQLRPAKKRPYQWIFEFFLRDWLQLDEILPATATTNQKIEENLRKKFVSKIAKSDKIASNCCFLPLKIEEKLKKSLHCLAVPTEIRTGNFFILP